VIDTSLVDAVKSDPRLSFDEAVKKGLFVHYSGFEAPRASTATPLVRDSKCRSTRVFGKYTI
jgi:hypothetical protein